MFTDILEFLMPILLAVKFARVSERPRIEIKSCQIKYFQYRFFKDTTGYPLRECVLVYKGWSGGNILIFSLWGGGKRYSLGDGTWNITTGAVSESETSCLTILVSVWEARRDKEKQGLATRSVSYNQETLPSFFLPLLVVTKVNILAEAGG